MQHLTGRRVVLDDQHDVVAVGRTVLPEDAGQAVAVDRLRQVLRRSEDVTHLRLVHHRHHDHRYVGEPVVGFDRRQHRPPVHFRHQHVEEDQVGADSPREGKPLHAVRRGERPQVGRGRADEARQEVAHRRVVVDHQNDAAGRPPRRLRFRSRARQPRQAAPLSRPTTAGRRRTNVEPSPARLETETVPPIISQNRLLIASPRPVPPYLRVVETSACVNGWNSLAHCSGVMPIPVSVIVKTNHSCPGPARFPAHRQPDLAILGELARVGQQVEQDLPQLRQVRAHRSGVRRHVELQPVRPLLHQRIDGRGDLRDHRADVDGFEVELHLPGLDLRQVQHAVDQRPAGGGPPRRS